MQKADEDYLIKEMTRQKVELPAMNDRVGLATYFKFHSSDYVDALEMDMEPLEGSQYWVCPVIVEYMNDRFDKELLRYIQESEGHGMQFLAEYYNS